MVPPRTYEVYSGFELHRLEADSVVNWAVDALVAGHDTGSLRILAGLEPPLDREEVAKLHQKTFIELGISPPPLEAQVRFHITSVLKRMLAGFVTRKETLSGLSHLCIARGHSRDLMDFYLLYHAICDLESGVFQYYWANADRSNIDQVVDEYAQNWLSNNSCDEAA
jgi:hypothetical protein